MLAWSAGLILLGLAACGGGGSSTGPVVTHPAPAITSFSPTSGGIGTTVTVTGSAFTGATAVAFNGTAASSFAVATDTSLTAVVAAGTATGAISVTTPAGAGTSSASFAVTAAPTLTGFSPASGGPGTSVTLTGTNFTGATAVTFDGIAAASYTVNSATTITAVAPGSFTSGAIAVTTPGGAVTSSSSFAEIPAPTITGFTPTSGVAGTVVALTGTNFTGATAVEFNGIAATSFTVNDVTAISATVPAGGNSGTVSVTTPGGTATSSVSFTVIPAATNARFYTPVASAYDAAGNLYVADRANQIIRFIDAGTGLVTSIGTRGVPGFADTGAPGGPLFNTPSGIAVDTGSGNVYVADTWNYAIRKITGGPGSFTVTTLAGTGKVGFNDGSAPGSSTPATFFWPQGVAVGASGNVWVADTGANTIREITGIGGTLGVTTVAGNASTGGGGNDSPGAQFWSPQALAVDPGNGDIYVADTSNATIRRISGGVVSTLAGTAQAYGSVDATGAAARFLKPTGIAVDANHYVYVADADSQSVRVIIAGAVTTFVGTTGVIGSTEWSMPARAPSR